MDSDGDKEFNEIGRRKESGFGGTHCVNGLEVDAKSELH